MCADISRVTHVLDDAGIEYVLTRHHNAAFTCEDVAQERGLMLSQVLKCLIGKDSGGTIYVMLLPGNRILDIKKVRCLAERKIALIPREELADRFGLIVGAVTPIQFLDVLTNVNFYLDETALQEEYIDISSGSLNAGIRLKIRDLVKLIKPMIGDIVSTKTKVKDKL